MDRVPLWKLVEIRNVGLLSLSQGIISPVSSLHKIPTSPHRPGKLPCELLATAAVHTSYN